MDEQGVEPVIAMAAAPQGRQGWGRRTAPGAGLASGPDVRTEVPAVVARGSGEGRSRERDSQVGADRRVR